MEITSNTNTECTAENGCPLDSGWMLFTFGGAFEGAVAKLQFKNASTVWEDLDPSASFSDGGQVRVYISRNCSYRINTAGGGTGMTITVTAERMPH